MGNVHDGAAAERRKLRSGQDALGDRSAHRGQSHDAVRGKPRHDHHGRQRLRRALPSVAAVGDGLRHPRAGCRGRGHRPRLCQSVGAAHPSLSRGRTVPLPSAGADHRRLSELGPFRVHGPSADRNPLAPGSEREALSPARLRPRGPHAFDPGADRAGPRAARFHAARHRVVGWAPRRLRLALR
jgi:hypothetical protein